MKFETFIKSNIEISPGRNLDHIILNNAAQFFPQKENEWIKIFAPVAMFCFALVLVGKLTTSNETNMNIAKFDDSIELISHYDEIELMADASLLTDKEWDRLK